MPKSIKQNMAWNTAGSLIYLGLQWAITIVVVRLSSGYDAAGQFALASSIANIFTPVAMYKIRAFQVSDTDKEYTTGEYVGFRLITIVGAFFVTCVYSVYTCDESSFLVVLCYLLFKSVDVFIDVLHGVDQKNGRMDYIGQSFILRGVFSFAAFCAALYMTNNLLMAVFSMFAVTLPVAIFFDIPKARQFGALSPVVNFRLTLSLSKRCLPAVLAALFCAAAATVPRQYLAWEFGDTALGIYSSVAAPVAIVQMGASYLYNPFLVTFANLFANHNARTFSKLLWKIILGVLIIGVICVTGFALFGEWILAALYGDEIRQYVYLLMPLLFYTLLTGFLWFFSDLLIVVRSMWENFWGNVILFVSALPLTVFFVHGWNMNGVSFAGIASSMIALVVLGGTLFWKVKGLSRSAK